MNPLDFLAVVLPSSGHGHYCVAELTTPRKQHNYKEVLTDLAPSVERFVERKLDTYMALATFTEAGSRTAANASHIQSLFVDIDCNHKLDIPDAAGVINPKAYPSAKRAVKALSEFLAVTGLDTLGQPWMVSSGGGVHAYWPLTAPVAIEDWKPVAENFKSLCAQHKLGIDNTVTADPARVMRLPGSTNTGVKGVKQVRGATQARVVSSGGRFELEAFAKIVREKLIGRTYEDKQPAALSIPGKRPTNAPKTAQPLFETAGTAHTSFKRILKRTVAGTGCGQLQHYMENAQDDGMEPLWRGLLSWAKCCETDGWKSAQRLSALHPYEPERLTAKWVEIKGPYACSKMDSENPGICGKCPHFGKITNPLALGRMLPEDTASREVELPNALRPVSGSPAEVTPVRMIRPDAPKHYGYVKGGGVFAKVKTKDADGDETERDIPILPHDLFVVRTLRSEGLHTTHFLYNRPDGAVDVLLPQRATVTKDEVLKVLAEQNVLSIQAGFTDKLLFEYVRACVTEAHKSKAIDVPAHGGWQMDNTYVHGGKIFSANALPLPLPMPGLENINNAMIPQGTLDLWKRFMEMMVRKELYDILAIFLVSAGAPLMRFTGISGITFHFTSRASGTGKSLGLDAAASIWGQPTRYRVSRDTSPVAMQQRLGLLNSTPLITDEITQKNRNEDMEWLPSFLFDMAEGKGKERMEAGSNKERINTTYWNTVAMLTSNNPAVDYLTGTRAHSSEGELRRLLELVMEKPLEWGPGEVEIVKSLQNNCGHLGPILIQYMVDNFDAVAALTSESVRLLSARLGASGDERYWMAGIGCALTAGMLLSKGHTGALPLPLKPIEAVFRKMLDGMREHTRSGVRTAADVLGMFVRENYGSFVSILYVDSKPTVAGDSLDLTQNRSLARLKIMGRVERGLRHEEADIFIEERVIRAFCAAKSFGYDSFRTEIAETCKVSFGFKNLTAKTDGPDMRVRAMRITSPANMLDDPNMAANTAPQID